jgi:5-methylcytosine-specific restriction endonuclease McrA
MACLWCGGDVSRRLTKCGGPQPRFCSTECRRQHRKAYYAKWWAANRPDHLVKMAARVAAFNAKRPSYFREYYAKNKERKKREAGEWYKANTERALETQRQYAKAHPELIRAHSRRSRAKRRALIAAAFIESVDPKVVFSRDNGVCGICRCQVDPASKWEIDHIMPIARGGAHSYANSQLAHRRCNRKKSVSLPAVAVAS